MLLKNLNSLLLRYETTSFGIYASRSFSCLTITTDRYLPQKKQPRSTLRLNSRSLSFQDNITGFWKTLSDSTPVSYMQDALIKIHDTTGLPWWASIVFSTFLFRSVVTLPLAIYQQKIVARIENIALEMPEIVKELKIETAMAMKKFNWDEKHARAIYNRSLKKQWTKLIIRDNCHPLKTMIVLWGQIPLWIFQSVAIRNLVYMLPDRSLLQAKIIFTQLTVGGFGWIPNLTEVDSSFILPVALGIINLSIIEMQTMTKVRPPTRLQRYATNAFRILSIAMIPIATSVPSCLCVYWVSSSAYGLAQNILLMSTSVKRMTGIPITPTEIKDPYQHLARAIQARIGLLPPKEDPSK